MGKFKFRLEVVEKLRIQTEEQMRSKFGMAQKDVVKEHTKLQEMIDRSENQTDVMKSKIMDATLVVITPRKLSWFDIDVSPLARYTTTDCVRPKLEIIQNVPANAIRYPISP